MLASPEMRAARELWSPLGAALVLSAAALFFGGAFAATRGLPGGAVMLLPLVALALWCAASVAWSIEPDRSWDYANRTVVYAAFAILGAFVAGRTRELAVGLC